MFRPWWFSQGLITTALVTLLLVLALARPLGNVLWRRATNRPATMPPPTAVLTTAATVEQVQQLAELTSLRIRVVDILSIEQAGWFTGFAGVWLIRGDALWITDLSHARMQEFPSAAGKPSIRIELPRPDVRWARLDHSQTRTFDVRSKSWLPLFRIPEAVRDDAMRQAQDLVERAAQRDDYRQQAERQTERVLTTFFAQRGWDVEIVWQDPAPESSTAAP